MIRLITGLPGGYKTYSAVQDGIKHLAKGGTWITNVELNNEPIRSYLKHRYQWDLVDPTWTMGEAYHWTHHPGQLYRMSMDELFNFYEQGPRGSPDGLKPLYTLDEISEELDAYDNQRQKDTHRELLSFFRLHRHYHIDIDLITQHGAQLNARVRRLAQYQIVCMDMQAFVLPPPFSGLKWPLPQLRRLAVNSSGATAGNPEWEFKDHAIYKLYNSYQDCHAFNVGETAQSFQGRNKTDKGKWPVWFKTIIACTCLVMGYQIWTINSTLNALPDDIQNQLNSLQQPVWRAEPSEQATEERSEIPDTQIHSPDALRRLSTPFHGYAATSTGTKVNIWNRWFTVGDTSELGKLVAANEDKAIFIDPLTSTTLMVYNGDHTPAPETPQKQLAQTRY